MKFLTVAALAGAAVAYPGSKSKKDHSGVFKAIIERAGERLLERQAPPAAPVILIGDLQDEGTGGTTTNDQIMDCFNSPNGASCLVTETYTPPTKDTTECEADTCCIWSYIKDDLVPLFLNTDGTCGDVARSAVRFGFHDAAAWNTAQTHGGADGSLLLSTTETSRSENAGLNVAKSALLPIYLKYQSYGISAADLVQFAHNVAVVTCPLGPRALTYIGRPEWKESDGENPTGLLPDAKSPADVLIDLFGDKTIGEVDLVALLGAHSTAKQFFFDASKAGQPLDSTPGVWDVAFYSEVLNGTAPCGVFRLPSDDAIGNDTTARGGFNAFSAGFPADTGAGQILWNGLYAKAYTRLSLLGVAGIQGLTDCSKVLPLDTPTFVQPEGSKATCPASSSSSAIPSSTSSAVSSSTSSAVLSSYTSSAVPSSSSSSDVASSYSSSDLVSSSSWSIPSSPEASSSSVKTFSSLSYWDNSTASWPTGKPSGSEGPGGPGSPGNGGKPTSSKGSGGYGGKPSGSSGPAPTSKPHHPGGGDNGDGSWGKTTTTVYTTKTVTVTDKWGHLTTSTVVDPITSVWDITGPHKVTTVTTTKTTTITLHGGEVTTSTWVEPITTTVYDDSWTFVPSVTAAAVKPSSCKVKTVTVTTTAWV